MTIESRPLFECATCGKQFEIGVNCSKCGPGPVKALDNVDLVAKAQEITATYAPGELGLTNRLVREFEILWRMATIAQEIKTGYKIAKLERQIAAPVLVDRGDLTEQPKDANGRLLLNAYGRAAWAAGHDTATKEYAIELKNARETAERLREDYLRKCEALAKPKANVAMVAQELRGLSQIRKIVYRSADTTAAFVERLANILDPEGRV